MDLATCIPCPRGLPQVYTQHSRQAQTPDPVNSSSITSQCRLFSHRIIMVPTFPATGLPSSMIAVSGLACSALWGPRRVGVLRVWCPQSARQAQLQPPTPLIRLAASGIWRKRFRRVSSSWVSCSTRLRRRSFSAMYSSTFCCVSIMRRLALSRLLRTAMLLRSRRSRYSRLSLFTAFLPLWEGPAGEGALRRGLHGGAAAATGAWRVSQRDREVRVHQEAGQRLRGEISAAKAIPGASKD